MRRLQSLIALRFFEETAQHLSYFERLRKRTAQPPVHNRRVLLQVTIEFRATFPVKQ
jgi:hypothetical protein